MTHAEAVAFWYGRINFEHRPASSHDLKLERMRALLSLLGDPHDRLRIAHVTGTKGKGSTCAMLDAVLRDAGYRVGLFTSPHLVGVEERFRVNGAAITPAELAAILTDVAPMVHRLDAATQFPPITFFEISAAVAFLHFVRRRVEVVLLEVGLGGRFDSTNVCHPMVSVITSVGMDHMSQLGATPEAIAYQKAGVIKPRVPVLTGVTEAGQPGAHAVIARVAAEGASPLASVGREVTYRRAAGGAVHYRTARDWPPLTLGLLGAHQAHNAAVALLAVEQLRRAGLTIPDASVARGFAGVRWPARVEPVGARPTVVVDSAHNVPSAEALVATLREAFPGAARKAVVFAVSSDKQYAEMLRLFAGYFDHVHLTAYTNNARSVPPAKLAGVLEGVAPGLAYTVHESPVAAWRSAHQAAKPDDLVCVTGSVFLAGELRDLVIRECGG